MAGHPDILAHPVEQKLNSRVLVGHAVSVGAIAGMSSTHHDLLGTTIDLRMEGLASPLSRVARRRALATIESQSRIFNVFDSGSEIAEARRTGVVKNGLLQQVLDEAIRWQDLTGGAFSPYSDGSLNLNGIAKGFIVDLACRAAHRYCQRVVISGGGDVRHYGDGSVTVGIEHPKRPYDNVAPFRRATISNQGLATSGTARRGNHILDPRTGDRVDHIASASVIAANAMTADVLATALTVLSVEKGLALIDRTPDTACLIVEATGEIHEHRWPDS